jgi:ABC-type nitrate/sulfonate/bicarbonate transport system ATPase subunit
MLDEEATGLLERVGLAGFGGAFPHEPSGGMQHRAAFARALAARPASVERHTH